MNVNKTTSDARQYAFSQSLIDEVQQCLVTADKETQAQQHPLNLISVGGLATIQDIAMSGELLLTETLNKQIYLKAFLSCFKQPLARVCLVRDIDKKSPDKVLYKNAAYPFFYHTVCISLNNFHKDIWESNKVNSSFPTGAYLLIEMLRPIEKISIDNIPEYFSINNPKKSIIFDQQYLCDMVNQDAIKHKSIQLVKPRLDILSITQMQYLLKRLGSLLHQENTDFDAAIYKFLQRWQTLYSRFEYNYAGEWSYQSVLNYFHDDVVPKLYPLLNTLDQNEKKIGKQIINIIESQLLMFPPAPQRINRQLLKKARQLRQFKQQKIEVLPQFKQPIFIVSAPRAGSTLLFETLSQFEQLWSTGEENHALIENITGLHPQEQNFNSNRLDSSDVTAEIQMQLKTAFSRKLINREQQHYLGLAVSERPSSVRFLEKTPKNALRIPFIRTLFPDAIFIYLHRDANSNISSLIDGWRSQRFFSYKNIPKCTNRHWSFLLTPNWYDMCYKSIAEIACQQWKLSNQIIQDDLTQLDTNDYISINYQDLIDQPETTMRTIASFAHLSWDQKIQTRCEKRLPVSRLTLTAPQKNKWLKHKTFIQNFIR